MSEVTLDCKGLPCPEPVLACKKAVESRPRSLSVQVDNEAARENVARFLTSQGYTVSWTPTGGAMTLTARPVLRDGRRFRRSRGRRAGMRLHGHGRGGDGAHEPQGRGVPQRRDHRQGRRGARRQTHGQFPGHAPGDGSGLWRIILVNGAVKMATTGHPCLEKLKTLEAGGVSVLVCGTCLDFFGLLEKKEAGQTTNMLDVVTSLDFADKVIAL